MKKRVPMKNLNARVEEKTLLELEAVAWYLNVRRSDLVRYAIEQFTQRGTIRRNDESWIISDLILIAVKELEKNGLELKDLIKKRKDDNEENAFSTEKEDSQIEELISKHVKAVKSEWERQKKEEK